MNNDRVKRTRIIEIEDPFTGERSFKATCFKPGCFYEPTTLGFCDEHFSLSVGLLEHKEEQ